MKIKVKRYKEIEKIALAEALIKIIKEVEVSTDQLKRVQDALKTLNLDKESIGDINAYLAQKFGLPGVTAQKAGVISTPKVGSTTQVGTIR